MSFIAKHCVVVRVHRLHLWPVAKNQVARLAAFGGDNDVQRWLVFVDFEPHRAFLNQHIQRVCNVNDTHHLVEVYAMLHRLAWGKGEG